MTAIKPRHQQASTPNETAVALERPMTADEAAVPGTGDWMSFAVDCLDNEQLSHCGHLDCGTIDETCRYCREITDHAREHTMSHPDRFCNACEPWRRATEDLTHSRWSTALGVTLGSWWLIDGTPWQIVHSYERERLWHEPINDAGLGPLGLELRSASGQKRTITDYHLHELAGTGAARLSPKDPTAHQ